MERELKGTLTGDLAHFIGRRKQYATLDEKIASLSAVRNRTFNPLDAWDLQSRCQRCQGSTFHHSLSEAAVERISVPREECRLTFGIELSQKESLLRTLGTREQKNALAWMVFQAHIAGCWILDTKAVSQLDQDELPGAGHLSTHHSTLHSAHLHLHPFVLGH
jgi:hypothetical protein